jgi:enamine deaminase RidA (YjgF/YER057c/UK114 family)
MSAAESKLAELGLTLPDAPAPAGAYVPSKLIGDILYLAGSLPTWNGEVRHKGQVGRDVDVKTAYEAAKLCTLNHLAMIKAAVGSLDRVRQVISVSGFVNCISDFPDSPAVLNGSSELLLAVFGEAGKHVRAAVGVAGLPRGAAVEVQMTVQISV